MCIHACMYMYVPICRLLGTGIRLEDNILVTDGTAEVLNKDCPELIEELTSLLTVS